LRSDRVGHFPQRYKTVSDIPRPEEFINLWMHLRDTHSARTFNPFSSYRCLSILILAFAWSRLIAKIVQGRAAVTQLITVHLFLRILYLFD